MITMTATKIDKELLDALAFRDTCPACIENGVYDAVRVLRFFETLKANFPLLRVDDCVQITAAYAAGGMAVMERVECLEQQARFAREEALRLRREAEAQSEVVGVGLDP